MLSSSGVFPAKGRGHLILSAKVADGGETFLGDPSAFNSGMLMHTENSNVQINAGSSSHNPMVRELLSAEMVKTVYALTISGEPRFNR